MVVESHRLLTLMRGLPKIPRPFTMHQRWGMGVTVRDDLLMIQWYLLNQIRLWETPAEKWFEGTTMPADLPSTVILGSD